jgi:5-enolpyruvylshikimate-3-phosphate synthase
MAARQAVSVDDTRMIATSFPDFERLMRNVGARFVVPNS